MTRSTTKSKHTRRQTTCEIAPTDKPQITRPNKPSLVNYLLISKNIIKKKAIVQYFTRLLFLLSF